MPSPALRRLAFAGSIDHPSIHPDDAGLAAALERLGIQPVACVWNDPQVDWPSFDAVLIRTTWDYFKHHEAFLRWLDRLDTLGVGTFNGSAVLRWNSDKRYLLQLADRGVPIIPTQLSDAAGLPAVLAAMPAQQVVVKPAISAGAWLTVRGTVGDAEFAAAVARLPHGHDYLVQPFVPEVVRDGEWSLLYFGGRFSHAVIKRPAAGDYRVQGEYGGRAEPVAPATAALEAAARALAAVADIGHGDPAYVRVDGVVSGGRFLVMELEMIEPFLHLGAHPAAAERFARHLAERLARIPAGATPTPASAR